MRCRKRCSPAKVLQALGLPATLLQAGGGDASVAAPEQVTLADLAAHTGIAECYLRSLGLRQNGRHVDIPYFNADGVEVAVQCRLRLQKPGRKPRAPQDADVARRPVPLEPPLRRRYDPRFRFRGDPRPYGLDRVEEAHAEGYAVIVEGESDCWTCWAAGIPALGLPGPGLTAAATGHSETADLLAPALLQRIRRVYVVREPNRAGAAFAQDVAQRADRLGVEAWGCRSFPKRRTPTPCTKGIPQASGGPCGIACGMRCPPSRAPE